MNHKYLLLASLLCSSAAGYAQQLSVGNGGLYIKSGATVVLDRLHLQPTQDIAIQNNILLVSSTPAPGTPNASIARVYKWTDTIQTKGLVGIYVQPSELNGNTFSLLQLAYNPTNNPNDYVVSNTSVAMSGNNFVFETMQPTVWKQLTAVESGSVLPLHLLSFTGEKQENTVALQWEVAGEENADKYIVERSTDGKNFNRIGTVATTCNGCNQNTDYNFIDNHPEKGNNYYRLQMMDLNQQSEYSNVVKIYFESSEQAISLSPNPATEKCRISGLNDKSTYHLAIVSADGRKVFASEIHNTTSFELNISTWSTGNYFIHLINDNGLDWKQKIIKK